MQKEQELSQYAPYFEGIELTTNTLEWIKGESSKKLLGSYRTPIHHLRVDGDRVIFLSNGEAHLSNFNLYLGFTHKNEIISEEVFKKNHQA